MNTTEFNKKLRKIGVLFDTIQENGTVSALEQDLMLSYIRDLYEVVMEANPSTGKRITSIQEKKPEINIPEMVKPTEERPVIDLTENVPFTKNVNMEQTAVIEQPIITKSVEDSKSVNTQKASNSENEAQAVVELFQEAKVTDLSDKLSQTPIKDLTKAMGINEKIFTVQELFGGNTDHFNKVMQDLNSLSDYSAAKNYMIGEVIPKYSWTAENKIKKAVTFIRMVRRRFM